MGDFIAAHGALALLREFCDRCLYAVRICRINFRKMFDRAFDNFTRHTVDVARYVGEQTFLLARIEQPEQRGRLAVIVDVRKRPANPS